ncbi:SDR family NAD(P)-dependent oxidoreductase [Microbacteriaceae bacterium VKM Ac-2855]|nr:SDR family NAD(P)-dependent oxidoreductase [Microbacteriaceae bacterium VKM Ac-2855]
MADDLADSITEAFGTSERLLAAAVDITDGAQIAAAVVAANERFGRIDVLVNNAGYGQLRLFEETTLDLIRKQIDTNVYGTMEITRAVLPLMRHSAPGTSSPLPPPSASPAAASTAPLSSRSKAGWRV